MEKYIQIILEDGRKINCELFHEIAPKSVELFLNNAKNGRYEGTIFHRIIKGFMIQGGGYYVKDMTLCEVEEQAPIKGEFRSNGFNNDLKHVPGVLSLARTSDPNSASGQFFICSANCYWLDGEYAAFGKVSDEASLKVVMELEAVQTGTLGPGFADFPYELIVIQKVLTSENQF